MPGGPPHILFRCLLRLHPFKRWRRSGSILLKWRSLSSVWGAVSIYQFKRSRPPWGVGGGADQLIREPCRGFCPSGAQAGRHTQGNTGSQEAGGCCSGRWENRWERHTFTSKMLPLVGGRDERAEHGRFLGPLSYSVWYYNHWNVLMYLSRPVEYIPRVNPKVIMCQR